MDSSQSANAYNVVERGEKRGPLDLTTLQTMRQQGTLAENTLVWCDGMSDWQSAASLLPQLFPAGDISSPGELYVASAGQRILVGLIDFFILQFMFVLAGFLTVGVAFILGEFFYPVLNAIYGGILISTSMQGSIGMKLLGLKVVDYAGRKPSPGQCWGRALGSILSFYFVIPTLIVFFTPRHQTMHDLMAGTLVVKIDRK
jgi:uncharacterized RDD family membrane protein YckC